MALFRAAAAAGLLLALAPDQTRHAVHEIFLGVERAGRELPARDELAAAAMRRCGAQPDACAEAIGAAAEAARRLRP